MSGDLSNLSLTLTTAGEVAGVHHAQASGRSNRTIPGHTREIAWRNPARAGA